MARGFLTSSRFSPGNLTPTALESLFVGRDDLLIDLLSRVRRSVLTTSKSFVLIVGARGSGKTHLISLLNKRLSGLSDNRISDRILVAYLNEEEWGVASYLDFLLRIISVATDPPDRDQARSILDTFHKSPDRAIENAERAITALCKGRTLVLLCENLADIFAGIGENGQQRWRAFIQNQPFWCVVATTPALFADVQVQTAPFFGFFTIRHLEKLTFEAALLLLKRIAELRRRPDLLEFLDTPAGRARVRAIHHLAGGNHRIYVVMSDFLDQQSLDDLVDPFMQMVDNLTPYYQDRIRQLAPQQRKLVEFMARTHVLINVKTIAYECLMSQQTAAKQLGELAKIGFVNRTSSGRQTFYELSEPLMRISLEIKDNQAEYLKLFVEFIRAWFSSTEIRERLGAPGVAVRRVDHLHMSMALAEKAKDAREPFLDALGTEAGECILKGDYKGAVSASTRLVNERGCASDFAALICGLRMEGDLTGSLAASDSALERYPKDPRVRYERSLTFEAGGRLDGALAEIDAALALRPTHVPYMCHRGELLMKQKNYEAAIAQERRLLEVEPNHAHSYYALAEAFLENGQYAEAEKAARSATKARPKIASAWALLARVLARIGKPDEVEAATDHALEIDPKSVNAMCVRGDWLLETNRYQEAIDLERRILTIDPAHHHSYANLATAFEALGQKEEAIGALRKLSESASGIVANQLWLAYSFARHELWGEALRVLESHPLQSGDEKERYGIVYLRVLCWVELGRYEDAADAVRKAEADGVAIEKGPWFVLRARIDVGTSNSRLAVDNALLAQRLGEITAENLVAVLVAIAEEERRLRGVGAVGPVLRLVASGVSEGGLRHVGAQVLTGVIERTIARIVGDVDGWQAVSKIADEVFGSVPEARIPLEVLGTAVEYGRSRDRQVLLRLPPEQRSLFGTMVPEIVPN